MKLYKITDGDSRTRHGMLWELGVTNYAHGEGIPRLCTNTVLHAYTSLVLAELMYPAHVSYEKRQYFEVEGEVVVTDGTKVGCCSLKVIRRVAEDEIPQLTNLQLVAFAILCSLQVYKHQSFVKWAKDWLTGMYRIPYTDDLHSCPTSALYAVSAADGYANNENNIATYAAGAAVMATNYNNDTGVDSSFIDFEALAQEALQVQ